MAVERTSCPNCGKRLKFETAMAGKSVRCPKCQHRLVIPNEEIPASVQPTDAILQTAKSSTKMKSGVIVGGIAVVVVTAAVAYLLLNPFKKEQLGQTTTQTAPQPTSVQNGKVETVVNNTGPNNRADLPNQPNGHAGKALDFSQPIHLLGHTPGIGIASLAQSPDGSFLASYSHAGEVILWDLKTGQGEQLTHGNAKDNDAPRLQASGLHVCFSADGKTLFSGSLGSVTIWDVETRAGRATLGKDMRMASQELVVSPDGSTLVTSAGDGASMGWQIWDVATQKPLITIPYPPNANGDAYFRFSHDSKTLAMLPPIAAGRGRLGINVFDMAARRELKPIQEAGAEDLLFLTDNTLGVWTKDKFSEWDLGDRNSLAKLVSRDNNTSDLKLRSGTFYRSIVLSPDRKSLLDESGNLCDFTTRKLRAKIQGMGQTMTFTADSRTVIAMAVNQPNFRVPNTIVISDVATGLTRAVEQVPYPSSTIPSAINQKPPIITTPPHRSDYVTLGFHDGSIVSYPLKHERSSLKEVATFPFVQLDSGLKRERVPKRRLSFTDDGRYLLGLGDRNIVWDVAAKKMLLSDQTPWPHTHRRDERFDRLSSILVVPEQDAVLCLDSLVALSRFSLSSGEFKEHQKVNKDGYPEPIYAAWRQAADGKTAAAIIPSDIRFATDMEKLVLIDPASLAIQKELLNVKRTDGGLHRITFSQDGKLLAVLSGVNRTNDAEVRLFELPSGKERPTTAKGRTGNLLTFVEGGSLLAVSAAGGGSAAFYDVETGQKVRVLDADHLQNANVSDVSLSPGATFFAAINNHGEVLLNDLKTGRVLLRHAAHSAKEAASFSCALSPDGKLLATAGPDEVLKWWDVSQFEEDKPLGQPQIVKLKEIANPVITAVEQRSIPIGFQNVEKLDQVPLAVADGGKVIAVHSTDGGSMIRFWDMTTGQEMKQWPLEIGKEGRQLHFTPDGNALFSSHLEVFVLSASKAVEATEEVEALKQEAIKAVAPDGKSIALGFQAPDNATAKLLRVLELPSLQQRVNSFETTRKVTTMTYTPDGKQLIVAIKDADSYRIELLNAVDGSVVKRLASAGHEGGEAVTSLTCSVDGRVVAAGIESSSQDRRVAWWDLNTGQKKHEVHLKAIGCEDLAFIDDGKALAALLDDGTIVTYDAATGSVRNRIKYSNENDPGNIDSILSSKHSRAFAAHANGEVSIWNLLTGSLIKKFKAHNGSIIGVATSGDERFIATAGRDNTVKVWELGSTAK